jgi:hypothetical protein
MKTLGYLVLAAALAIAAGCGDDDGDGSNVVTDGGRDGAVTPTADGGAPPDAGGGGTPDGGTATPDGGTAAIKLTDWVHDLVTNHTNAVSAPDTVEDKNIIDTTDPAAFDSFLQ